jgi:arylsulfatase A-like enzyme
VLLIILDTVRGASTSVHGYARRTTPRLEEWAAQGARYEHAFATAPWTLPSHASMFTGRWPHELTSSLRQPLDDTHPTLAEALRESGYATGAFAANLSYVTWQYGLDRGFLRFEDFPVTVRAVIVASVLGRKVHDRGIVRRRIGFYDEADRKPAATINAAFVRWLDRLDADRPWFAFLNYFDAHHPYLPPAPFDTMFGPKPRPRFRLGELKYESTTAEEIALEQNSYDGAIAYQDREIDRLLRELERRRLLDGTLVIVTSDHGEHWGEHQRLSHGNSMYRQLIEVPLVIRLPARYPRGSVVREPVSLRDIPATVLDAAGIANRWGFPGATLADFLRPGTPPRPVLSTNATLGAPEEASLVADGLHYVMRSKGPEELYDLAADPADSLDLAATPRGRAALPRFRALLDTLGHGIPATAPIIR